MTRRKFEPIEGAEYGFLIYLSEAERIVRPSKTLRAGMFKCVCGDEVRKPIAEVLQGSITSCGCMKGKQTVKDITGQKFNRLTALKRTDKKQSGGYLWTCQCDCGNIKDIPIGAICSGGGV